MVWHDPCGKFSEGSVFVAKKSKGLKWEASTYREAGMFKRAVLTAGAVLSTYLIFLGASEAQQMECKPLCFLTASSNSSNRTEGDYQEQGRRRADDVAGDHGSEGRGNDRRKQENHRPRGESGVSGPSSANTSYPPPSLDPSKLDPRVKPPTCSLC